ncbi:MULTISPECIES: amino acid ABC transporter permease [Paenibacillus]|uniref:ABC transporter permease subunit n=1 Tax=Paenibacillus lutrae TaxID=2078573 RepID=A0A7X3FMB8_9BACL|nr:MULTISPECIES: amino acid ABC transporter permease [Paenibacillus]MVP02384.1 ABC transporter permease subunit [Paenibacillus lutrae]
MDFAGAYTSDHLIYLLKGFLVTLEMAAIAIVLSFVIGSLIGVIRYSKIPVLSQLMGVWVELIRNLPLLLIIFFVYFAVPEITGWNMSILTSAIISLTIFESAMIAEIIRGGLNSIDKGQIEASRSSGLSYVQTLWHIVFPQALRRMVPPMVSQFISLLKDTSLTVIIAAPELVHNAQIINGASQQYVIPIFLLVALMYFTVNYCIALFAQRFELKRT